MSEGRSKPGIPLWYPLVIGGIIALLLLFVTSAARRRDGRGRTRMLNHFKQIAIALQSYQEVYKRLPPPAIVSKDGRPLLSWRVAILPFIEQSDLYRRFHLDEPWDSPHNKGLLNEQPYLFLLPDQEVQGEDRTVTYIQAFVGPGTPFDPNAECRIMDADVKRDDVRVLVIEAGDPVPWTKPEDIPFDPRAPLPPLGGSYSRDRGHLAVIARVDTTIAILEERDRDRLPRLIPLRGR